jgi:hypothetical protein
MTKAIPASRRDAPREQLDSLVFGSITPWSGLDLQPCELAGLPCAGRACREKGAKPCLPA